METFLFLDLDNTVFRTARRATDELGKVAALSPDGSPGSFMSSKQQAILERISQDTRTIPTTGRTTRAFQRVTIPFHDHAICSHGGIILNPGGEPNSEWIKHIREQVHQSESAFNAADHLLNKLGRDISERISPRIVSDQSLPMYLTANHPDMNPPELLQLQKCLEATLPEGFWIQYNGSELALIPEFITKSSAVRFLKQHLNISNAITIGFGDSLGDAGFLGECDYILLPGQSQLGSSVRSLSDEL